MATQTEASFECPVCGEACQAVLGFEIRRSESMTGSGAATAVQTTVKVRPLKLMGCVHVEAFNIGTST